MARVIIDNRKRTFLKHTLVMELFHEYIRDTSLGRRVGPKGVRVRHITVDGYRYTEGMLKAFTRQEKMRLRVYIFDRLSTAQREKAIDWNMEYYRRLTQYLYSRGHLDNYVGFHIKNLRSFLGYLYKERGLEIGPILRYYIVPKEEVPVVALLPDQLRYVIHSRKFNDSLLPHQERVRDIFVFGCTVALRYRDLMRLDNRHLRVQNGNYFLQITSEKTGTSTSLLLPPYAIEVVEKYRNLHGTLLPNMSLCYFNKVLKEIAGLFPDEVLMPKVRHQRGKPIVIYKNPKTKEHYKLSDHISSHVMRKTAITSMLMLGVPEYIVRQLSGHAPNSKEFYRYVQFSKTYMNQELTKAFDQLCTYNPYTELSAKNG